MAGLIPVGGGGGPPPPTCFRCNEPAAGPCAFCHTMICASEECSVVVHEPGLAEVVLCSDCSRLRPVLGASRLAVPALLAASVIISILTVSLAGRTLLAGVGFLAALGSLLLAGATAIARWQWRSRLRKARGGGS